MAVADNDEGVYVSAQITMPGAEGEAWIQLPPETETDSEGAADAFFIIGLILAIGSDGVLEMDDAVSRRLIYNSQAAQDILRTWYPKQLVAARLDVPQRPEDKTPRLDRTVSCFTGGVDSFDTLIRNESDIDALVYMHGFDIPLSRTDVREPTSAHLREVASFTGKQLIEGSTNIRRFLNRAGKWPTLTHGAALSSIGHLLSGQFGRQMIPASHTYSDTFAWGSHPLLDHLWSSNRLSIVHDGAGSTRVDKTKRVAKYPAAKEHLRVCWQNTGKYNCGVCDKCVRTMVALSLSGDLPEFKTFDSEISTDAIRNLKISGMNSLSFVQENLDFAREQGATEIEAALNALVADFEARRKTKNASGSVAALERKIAPLERRLARVETNMKATKTRAVAAEKSVKSLQKLLPIRTWTKISNARYGK
ncbi:hypothetical protein [Brevibacterium siliguriense]|uniref:hypothetical protein n=1 Tax=Brevibacterium siliguriense TaxID=1136497 RepID=UPI001E64227F|nr:hypothetical protein [Brevibacterium siliguriense]